MRKTCIFQVALTFLLLSAFFAHASSVLPMTTSEQIRGAAVVFRGTVLKTESTASGGGIYTVAFVRVDEPLKGKLPPIVKLVHSGGTVGGLSQQDGFSPQFVLGEERLFFVSRRKDGTLYAVNGNASARQLKRTKRGNTSQLAASDSNFLDEVRAGTGNGQLVGSDVTDQAGSVSTSELNAIGTGPILSSLSSSATGLILDTNNISSRFTQPDRGEPIPYQVDMDFLPAGMTPNQALNAVQTALAAWSSVGNARFVFEGVRSFGRSATNRISTDQKIYIQLHDAYGAIPPGNTLGVGGRHASSAEIAGWAKGGRISGSDFNQSVDGYVVLNHTKSQMQTISTFTEVLCHELGHALSMAHSSINPSESNPLLTQSIMYFISHNDGRGASLGTYDPPIFRQAYPTNNTPPYSFDRVMDIVTHSPANLNIPGINEIEIRGYDLQTTNLTFALAGATGVGGTFSLSGTKLKYTPNNYYSAERLDPAYDSYDQTFIRFSDGTNSSPYAMVNVISYSPDTGPTAGDGIPDNWMTTYFGNSSPTAGVNRAPANDFDGDGISNLQEYFWGSNPTIKSSNLHFTKITATNLQWEARPYELYEIFSSTNLTSWSRFKPYLATNAIAAMPNNATNSKVFYRVLKVP